MCLSHQTNPSTIKHQKVWTTNDPHAHDMLPTQKGINKWEDKKTRRHVRHDEWMMMSVNTSKQPIARVEAQCIRLEGTVPSMTSCFLTMLLERQQNQTLNYY